MLDINSQHLNTEKDQLKNVNSLLLVEYIKSSVEVLVSLKMDEDDNHNHTRKSLRSLQGCADMLDNNSRLTLNKDNSMV